MQYCSFYAVKQQKNRIISTPTVLRSIHFFFKKINWTWRSLHSLVGANEWGSTAVWQHQIMTFRILKLQKDPSFPPVIATFFYWAFAVLLVEDAQALSIKQTLNVTERGPSCCGAAIRTFSPFKISWSHIRVKESCSRTLCVMGLGLNQKPLDYQITLPSYRNVFLCYLLWLNFNHHSQV